MYLVIWKSAIIKIYNIDGKTASTQIFTEMQALLLLTAYVQETLYKRLQILLFNKA